MRVEATLVDRFVRTGELRVHYLDWGGGGPPVVLIHSAYSTAHVWDLFAPTIVDEFRVLAPDLRGYGQTDRPPTGYSARELAEDLYAFARALELEPFHLVGHSVGTRLGCQFAAHHPEMLRSLALVDCTGFRAVTQQEPNRRSIEQLHLAFASPEEAAEYLRTTHKKNFWSAAVIQQRIDQEMDQLPGGGVAWQYSREVLHAINEAHDDDVLPVVGRIRCPTLLLRGSESPNLGREESQQLQNMIAGSELAEIGPAAHYLHLDQPEQFARVTRDFLLRHR